MEAKLSFYGVGSGGYLAEAEVSFYGVGSGGYLVEAEVSFYGVGSEEELSVTVQDHEEAVQSLQQQGHHQCIFYW